MRNSRSGGRFRLIFLYFCAFFALIPPQAWPQSSETAPVPIPLSDVSAQAEVAAARLHDIGVAFSSDRTAENVTADLPALTREIDVRLRETRRIAAQRPSLEMLGRLEAEWRRLRGTLSEWSRALGGRIERMESDIAQLDELSRTWQLTLQAANEAHAPPEVLQRIAAVMGTIGNMRQTDRQSTRLNSSHVSED